MTQIHLTFLHVTQAGDMIGCSHGNALLTRPTSIKMDAELARLLNSNASDQQKAIDLIAEYWNNDDENTDMDTDYDSECEYDDIRPPSSDSDGESDGQPPPTALPEPRKSTLPSMNAKENIIPEDDDKENEILRQASEFRYLFMVNLFMYMDYIVVYIVLSSMSILNSTVCQHNSTVSVSVRQCVLVQGVNMV